MFRTVYISGGEKLRIKDNWLTISMPTSEKQVPIGDIRAIVVDNIHALASMYTLQALAKENIAVIICDDEHLPCCNVVPLNQHYRPYGVLKRQLALTEEFKNLLWARITRSKILNQSMALWIKEGNTPAVMRLEQLAAEVLPGDIGNREGIAAKMFFRNFYGYNFIRFEDDIINSAMNYGYAIMRSTVAQALCSYGYNCALGIHHINENNPFNLADDFMEPLRPLVDLWIDRNNEDLVEKLTKTNKIGLINVVNSNIFLGDKLMKVHNAIDKYVGSLTTAIEHGDVNRLQVPLMGERNERKIHANIGYV